jgi:membrane protein YdbS with pleckstrin-like domain
MTKPDLATREGRRAYGAELSGVARGWRYAGLSLVAIGAVLLIVARLSGADIWHSAIGLGAVAALVVGWGLAIVGIVKRTRYHRRRMAG